MITLIVAVAEDGAIGKDGDLLWHLSGDLKRFKALTTGHSVVMGRKTWESLPRRPLPQRNNIVITHNRGFEAPGAIVTHSIQEAIKKVKDMETLDDNFFIIGGSSIYNAFLPLADAIDLTIVKASYPDADAWFSLPNAEDWKVTERSEIQTDEKSGLQYQHLYLTRNARSDNK